ncbi:MAG: hypothetical protein COB85_04235 [Bacteroidetes bacterium]|nr:MAG: hypothetical protein COB85_04235 [Bacteroidota bacterium]
MSDQADIYISFSDLDNASTEEAQGWVTQVSQFLAEFLKHLLDRKVNIVLRSDQPKEVMAKTFIYILSENNIGGKSTIKEFESYLAAVKDVTKMFKALKTPVDRGDQPEVLKEEIGFRLYEKSGDSRSQESTETSSIAWLRLVDLAYDIYGQIAEIDGITKKEDQGVNKNVFLAEVSVDQEHNHDEIKRELLMHGYKVLPDRPVPDQAEKASERINNYLSESIMSIHIIGEEPGFVPEGSEASIVEIQNTMAAQYCEIIYSGQQTSSNGFNRLLWISPEIEFTNEQQKMEVDRLKQDMAALKGAEIIQTPLEVFKTVVMRRLEETVIMNATSEAGDTKSQKSIYIIYEKSGMDVANKIEDIIIKDDLLALHPLFEGDQLALMDNHRSNLIDCDATIIVYGEGNPSWISSKIKELKKAPGFGREKPFLFKTIITQNKKDIDTDKLASEGVEVLEVSADLSPANLKPLLEKMAN